MRAIITSTIKFTEVISMNYKYEENPTKLWMKIGTHGVMTLSTRAENRVTSR